MDTKQTGSEGDGSPKYWLSLDQWSKDPEFQRLAQNEFQSSPLSAKDGEGGWARREFLKVMGASMALSAFGCVRRPAQKIVPYVKRPPEITPGKINYYSSSFADGSMGFGLVVATREGRPIKLEGNNDFPVNKGGMSARAHAHLLALYDPDRAKGPQKNELNPNKTNYEALKATINWENLDKAVAAELEKGSVGILVSSIVSPSTRALLEDFARAYGAQVYVWEPLAMDSVREGQKACYGQNVLPHFRIEKAKYIVSLDADILGTLGQPVEQMRLFSQGRSLGKDMNKLVCFESLMSLTGTNADERYRIRPSQQVDVVMGIIYELVVGSKLTRYSGDSTVKSLLEPYANVSERLGFEPKTISRIAADLWAHRGESLVLAGGMTGQTLRNKGLQAAVNFLNSILENDGSTIDAQSWTYTGYVGSSSDISELVSDIEGGRVKRLIIQGANPGYALPKSVGFHEAMKKVE
ncbi:MAG: TAT-variant-translocated molybdopterin oxidoreductase, partial [Bdellovibrionales bacterium]|nr:TAT-variant-translocated molybdopterin oxidoreductase [Bdellovibrionales bacterium]